MRNSLDYQSVMFWDVNLDELLARLRILKTYLIFEFDHSGEAIG